MYPPISGRVSIVLPVTSTTAFLGDLLVFFTPQHESSELAGFLSLLLSGVGLTVLIVWPQDGPGAFIRERLLRPLLPGKLKHALDCYICLGFWSGLLLSIGFWWAYRTPWSITGCLMIPAIFWVVLRAWEPSPPPEATAQDQSADLPPEPAQNHDSQEPMP